jgi:hypothetical protein
MQFLYTLLIIGIIVLFAVDAIQLFKQKKKAELTVFLVLVALSCILLICASAGLPVTLKSLNELLGDFGRKLFG